MFFRLTRLSAGRSVGEDHPLLEVSSMYSAMIMSLGGAPEPLRQSIEEHRPATVVFLASHQSVVKACEVLQGIDPVPTTYFEITENSDVLLSCYEAASRCVRRLEAEQVSASEVMVDYTGGTKPMVAALVLATVGRKYHFNYVGGTQRDKQGLGIVQSGSEIMMTNISPWAAFAEEERRNAAILFNERRFAAVKELLGSFDRINQMPHKIRSFFSWLTLLSEGYALWERFEYKKAAECIKEGSRKLREHLELEYHEDLDAVKAMVEHNADFLSQLLNRTRGLNQVHVILVEDLLANAQRRIEDRQFEDAAARIYRALEMYGQDAFLGQTGHTTSDVPLEQVPESIRDEYSSKHFDSGKNKLQLPLFSTFRFLAETGNPIGLRFETMRDRMRAVTDIRNHSFLAHGIQPIGESQARSFLDTVTEFTGIHPVIEFPRLP